MAEISMTCAFCRRRTRVVANPGPPALEASARAVDAHETRCLMKRLNVPRCCMAAALFPIPRDGHGGASRSTWGHRWAPGWRGTSGRDVDGVCHAPSVHQGLARTHESRHHAAIRSVTCFSREGMRVTRADADHSGSRSRRGDE